MGRLKRLIALLVCASLVAAGVPRGPERAAASSSAGREGAGTEQAGTENAYRLRDALPAVVAFSEPPDSTEDEIFLPEEQDSKKLIRDIAAFVVASAFIAYFIIKVFIEEDEEPAKPPSNGKPTPTSS